MLILYYLISFLMVSLVKKMRNGKALWYLVKSARVNGKPRIVWQKYLGTAERIMRLLEGPAVESLHTVPFGTLGMLLDANEELRFVDSLDRYAGKRKENGLSVGQYMLMFILGRAEEHRVSKSGLDMWAQTSYLSHIWRIPDKIACQTYLDQMDYVTDGVMEAVFTDMCKTLVSRGVSMKRLVFDITNVATNIEKGETLPQPGPSKEKRFDKNLLSFGIAINEDNIPIFSEMHPGNENDAKVFSQVVEKLTQRVEALNLPVKDVVLSIDRGMNSDENIDKIVEKMHVIGGLKRNQVGELLSIPLSKFKPLYTTSKGHKVLGLEKRREVFGRTYRIILSYNEGTATRQKEQYEKEKERFLAEVSVIQASLSSRRRGRKPTQQSIARRLTKTIHDGRESVFKYNMGADLYSKQGLNAWIDTKAEERLVSSFGKQVIFTDMEQWSPEDVVRAYNGKAMIEDDFKLLKDRLLLSVMPEWHWKDPRIKVHIFLCLVGLTMYRYVLWKLREIGMSIYELDRALKGIRVGFVVMKGENRKVQQVMEKMTPEAAKVFSKLDMGRFVKK